MNEPSIVLLRVAKLLCAIAVLLAPLRAAATALLGLTEIAGSEGDGPVTLFYPTSGEVQRLERGAFTVRVAWQGPPVNGNRRLVVLSHGSGSSPWGYADLASALVESGFVVALPEHRGDNYKHDGSPGPDSWKLRPAEVSRAIDAVERDARFAPLLALDRVGVYGMSAGGHTALTLAGGRWSPARLKLHCEAHIDEDFHGCVGPATKLTGGMLDGLKKGIALAVIRLKLDDSAWYAHTDPRVAAVVAGVPFAADFDPASLQMPVVPLGIIAARQDKWLNPKYHSDVISKACSSCEQLDSLPTGGHGALLSPLPPVRDGLLAELISDPPGFDRAVVVPEVNRKISAFFVRHLVSAGQAQ